MTAPAVKYEYRSTVRWAFMQWADIPDAQDPSRVYLRRLRILQVPMFALYLHFIYVPDGDRDPHNHPMNFWSFVIRGAYFEQRYRRDGSHIGTRLRRRGTLAHTTIDDFHRIASIRRSPTITLLFVGKRSQSWGFLTPDGYVDKLEYFAGPKV
jgi:hypothetical protein